MWNAQPGGLYTLPQFSTSLADFPFYYCALGRWQRWGGARLWEWAPGGLRPGEASELALESLVAQAGLGAPDGVTARGLGRICISWIFLLEGPWCPHALVQ